MSIDREMRKAVQNTSPRFLGTRGSLHLLRGAKAAVIQFTRIFALQYARSSIRANTILPGMMNTPMVHAAEVRSSAPRTTASLSSRDPTLDGAQ
jgi:NAD(P)-dependent dehydrogenase (short-subunit alcohol dehydrogenase family)